MSSNYLQEAHCWCVQVGGRGLFFGEIHSRTSWRQMTQLYNTCTSDISSVEKCWLRKSWKILALSNPFHRTWLWWAWNGDDSLWLCHARIRWSTVQVQFSLFFHFPANPQTVPSCSILPLPLLSIFTRCHLDPPSRYKCLDGLQMMGEDTLFCDGHSWNGSVPFCPGEH